MSHHYHKVNPLLSDYVRTVLVLEKENGKREYQLPLFTSGTPVLLCRTRVERNGAPLVLQLSLYGSSAPADCWTIGKGEMIIAYFFKPFTMSCLLNLSAEKLAQNKVELLEWNRNKAGALNTQLISAGSSGEKIKVLDIFLLVQVGLQGKYCSIIRAATDTMLLHPGKEVIADLLNDLDMNERTFQRLFKKYVGVTPTQFRRICQFKYAFDKLKTGTVQSLTDLAYDSGFADQSHFIRSFREHAHTTPKDYVKSGLKKK